jgi:hypothetical protein
MTSINPALSFVVSPSLVDRAGAAERLAEDALAAQLKQAADQANLVVGTTITARYQYKVGPNGTLIKQQAEISATVDDALQSDAGKRNRQALRDTWEDRRPTFADLAKPKADLSPAAETEIFAGVADELAQAANQLRVTLAALVKQTAANEGLVELKAEVLDESGEEVNATLLAPNGEPIRARNEALLGNYAARAQFAVAGLYARNSDTVYRVQPVTQFAA